MAGASDEDDEARRNPLLDPRLAGAGGLLITAAALAFVLAHGGHHAPGPASAPSPKAAPASASG
ncbi:hypothetical protein [Streptacidiphilus melanogenes]|uniref:hypothetical protein n=1 Tax=Streptacidiphilus melanogenes TaxID=411235 RepID=UPI0005A8B44B|nr:hypothetical protein [Streptacidiphilus melanogenes]